MTRVKICGITDLRDAAHAVECGADAIGFIFAKSPRRISVKTAGKICRAVGPWVATVGVFVNENADTILRIVSECRLSAVQLHGDEPASFIHRLSGCKVIKTFRVSEKADLRNAAAYRVDAYLFDTKVSRIYGGSGTSFDWRILRSETVPRPIILSGGLNPQNVKSAVRMLKPYGVDVSSGVEKSPGHKDLKLMRKFIQNAKNN